MARKEPIQGARFSKGTLRHRVQFLRDKDVPERFKAIAPGVIRYQVTVNDNGEILSLDDVIATSQVAWTDLNKAADKGDPSLLPAEWYCVRTLRIAGQQIVMHWTFSNCESIKELEESLKEHLYNCFPDPQDPQYQRESHRLD